MKKKKTPSAIVNQIMKELDRSCLVRVQQAVYETRFIKEWVLELGMSEHPNVQDPDFWQALETLLRVSVQRHALAHDAALWDALPVTFVRYEAQPNEDGGYLHYVNRWFSDAWAYSGVKATEGGNTSE